MSKQLERVQRGARLLDEKVPEWFNKIDIETLNIASCLKCVLGQLFGYFSDESLNRLGLTLYSHDDIEHGFLSQDGFNKTITLLWIEEIKQRRMIYESHMSS